MTSCIDLTGPKSVARTTLAGLSETNKRAVNKKINNTLKTKINKEVKSTILDVAHRELLDRMNCEHLTKSVARADKMVHPLKPTILAVMGTVHTIKVGDWVEVLYDYAPGTCSDGGIGTVSAVNTDEKGNVFCSVGYVLDKRIETSIEARRITVTMMPYKEIASSKRVRREPLPYEEALMPSRTVAVPIKSPLEWLESGLKSRSHEKSGWLKEKLLHYGLMEASREAMWQRILSDYKCQLSGIEGMKVALGASFTDPREHKGNQGHGGKFISVKKDSQVGVPKNMWTIPYLLHAYDVKRLNFQNKRKIDKEGAAKITGGYKKRQLWNKGTCVITNREAAKRKYNARYFFLERKR